MSSVSEIEHDQMGTPGREDVLLEVQVLEREVCLHNACGFDSGPQHILLGWDVGGLGYPVQIVQVAEREGGRDRGGK